jgi:hypothetical protein
MSEPHDWPIEQAARGSLRPWYFAAAGHVTVLFMDPEEAERARHDLIGRGVPVEDLRLYGAEETLGIMSRRQEERSILAKAFDALVADHPARERYVGNAQAGGSALWIAAPSKDRANRLVGLLADFRYQSLRYWGEDGVEDVQGSRG